MPASSQRLADALGHLHSPAGADARIVSLVPSITELLFALGLGDQVAGRTGFCIHPREPVKAVPKVGGTKSVDIAAIRALAPTHLIVNIDENERPTVEQMRGFVPNLIVTHPLGPLDNIALYRLIGGIFGREARAEELCAQFQSAYDEAAAACRHLLREKVLYLIWKSPWMTVSRDTYIARTLAVAGWDTLEIDSPDRYPKIELTPGLLQKVGRILLSSEPYAFRERHLEEVRVLLSVTRHPSPVTVSLVDGEMTSWYGSRAIEGMRYLRGLRKT